VSIRTALRLPGAQPENKNPKITPPRTVQPTTGRRPVLGALAVIGYMVMIVPILFVVAAAFSGGDSLQVPP
jgi:hypothetical protein